MANLRTVGYASALLLIAPAADAATFTLLHTFGSGSDADRSQAPLTHALGKLFGTSAIGGTHNAGTIFEYGLSSGAEHVVLSFQGTSTGSDPRAPLLDIRGTLFGTTYEGGTSGGGTLFQFDPATHTATVLYDFGSGGKKDAAYPIATVTRLGNELWGTTLEGGTGFNGAVYEYDRGTAAYAVVASAVAPTEQSPGGPLTDFGGLLYGSTIAGGGQELCGNSCGTLYAINPASGADQVVHDFTGTDGGEPVGALLSDGTYLYGVTTVGGANNKGVVFKFDPVHAILTTLYSFAGGSDGAGPTAGLTMMNGLLYGTTQSGGSANVGTVFSLDPNTDLESVVYSFTGGADGELPNGVIAVDGTLYGTTSQNNANGGGGTLYALTP